MVKGLNCGCLQSWEFFLGGPELKDTGCVLTLISSLKRVSVV